jgi:hypothetical protein
MLSATHPDPEEELLRALLAASKSLFRHPPSALIASPDKLGIGARHHIIRFSSTKMGKYIEKYKKI